MRFLHTSDWHVGKAIRGRSRLDEFAAALDEVVRIAEEERVDAVLISGDLYEQKLPSPEADKLVFETLARLFAAKTAVVAIPGNHDSALRWEALDPLLRPLGGRVVPWPVPPAEGSLVEVPSRDGSELARVACVPFVPERHFGSTAALFAGSERWAQEYAQGMGDLLTAMTDGFFRADAVNVLMAHLFATEVELGGGENELTVTLDYAVPPSRFPGTASYIALGHVHKPQHVRGSPAPARYAGSLLQLDFGERAQGKSVTVVEASAGKPARLREVPLTAGRPLVDLEGTLDELRARAAEVGDAWLRVTLRTDTPVPGIQDQVRDLLPNAVHIAIPRPEEEAAEVSGLMRLAAREQFLAYYRSAHGAEPGAETLAAFTEVLAAVRGEAS